MTMLYTREPGDQESTPVTSQNPLPVAESGRKREWQAVAFEQVTVAATSIGFTYATTWTLETDGLGFRAVAQVQDAQLRYRYDGTTAPTATVGMNADAGDILVVEGLRDIQRFRAIRTGGVSAILNITYLNEVYA